jgi:glutathione S-transferase
METASMLKIWGRTNSVNVKKVLWCADELGIPYERSDAGLQFGVVNEAWYRKMNPNGLVPTVEDDGLVLWESNTIVRHLASKNGPSSLSPADPGKRAAAEKWMDWTLSSLGAPYRDVFWGLVRTPPEKRNLEQIEASRRKCIELWAMVDAALADRPYVGGEQLSVGDIPLGCFAYAWYAMPIERPAMQHLDAWYQRLCARPAYKKNVMLPLS